MSLSPNLLEILVCPGCKGALVYEPEHNRLLCNACRLAYPVRDEIPVLLIDEAEAWSKEEEANTVRQNPCKRS